MSNKSLSSENIGDSKEVQTTIIRNKIENSKLKHHNWWSRLIILSWIITLFASSISLIFWREFGLGEPFWWPILTLIIMLAIFISSLVKKDLKPLRRFIAVILIIFLFGYGGGWQWGIIPAIRGSSVWIEWMNQMPWALSSILTHLLRLSPALAVLSFLLITGRKRKDFFLVKGEIRAQVEPSKLIGMKSPEPWTKIGSIFAIVFTLGTLMFLLFSKFPSVNDFIRVLPLLPVSILIAAINAFNEEFTLRAAPLSELRGVIGKKQALLITTLYFGLGHYYGVPSGLIGIALSAYLGWFLGKSLLETKGFFWAWIIHFFPDVVIFTFYAMFP
ncbi:MAG: CPBP family intramembrane glutamic endopeptidase [Candidatus Hermodarchaeota archaeon]